MIPETSQGTQAWDEAIRLSPEYACDPIMVADRITDTVAGYARLAEASARAGKVRAVLDSVLAGLPEPLGGLRLERRRTLARIFAELAFLAAENEESGPARRLALECLVASPSWLRNLGLVKVLVSGGRHLWPEPIRMLE